jgi:autotransporter-associated beta strand protein
MKTTNVSITRTIAVALTMSAILLGQSTMGQNQWVGGVAPAPPAPIPGSPWDWSTGGNWIGGVPTALQTVQVSPLVPNAVAQVGTPGAVAGMLQIGNGGTVAVYLGGTLTVNILDIAVAAGTPGTFALNAGALTVDQLWVGPLGTYTDTGLGTLTLTGPGFIGVIPATTINSPISGTSGLISAGPGILTFAGNNSYSGGTIISNGVLQVGNGGTSGTLGSGAIINLSSLVFNRSNAITVGDPISGTGSLTMTGGGVLTLNGPTPTAAAPRLTRSAGTAGSWRATTRHSARAIST